MTVSAVQYNTASASPPPPAIHRVAPGETLTSIARDHGVSVAALERANPQVLHPDLIRPGQAIHIPAEHGAAAAQRDYTVRPGDTLSEIGQHFGVDWRVMAAVNGVTDPHALRAGTVLHVTGGANGGGANGAGANGTGGVEAPSAAASRPAAPKPAASPAPAASTGAGLPRTEGMSASQKYEVYAKYVDTYGDAHAKADLAAGRQVILGLRHDTNTHANGGAGVYDDRIVVLGGGRAREFSGNTDPSARYEGRDGADANGDGRLDLGRLAEGSARFTRSTNPHLGNVLRATGTVGVERDTNHDGAFTSADRNGRTSSSDGSFLIHAGGNNITGSAGCQTMKPAEFRQFWGGLSGGQRSFSYVLVDADRHGVDAAAAPAAPSAPAPAPAGGARLGRLSMVYETGFGPGQEAQAAARTSSGVGDAGGASYGAYQLASSSKGGRQPQAFLKAEGAPWASRFAGQDPTISNGDFARTWKAVAAAEPQAFFNAQHAYIERTHYQPVVDAVKASTGLDLTSRSRAVQDVVWSMSVQHGGAKGLVEEAVNALGSRPTGQDRNYDEALINKLYDVRSAYVVDVVHRPDLMSRYATERRDALAELGTT